jgi:ABC-type multidrug transport system fused ATPase/permease subunit
MHQSAGVAEVVRMALETEVFGVTGTQRRRVRALSDEVERHWVRTRSLIATVPVLYQSAVIVLLIAGLTVVYAMGTARLAALGAVVLFLVRAASYGQQFQVAYQGLGESAPYLARVLEATADYEASRSSWGTRSLTSVRRLQFEDVSFSYREDVPVLKEIAFSIEQGEAIGIVGPSGVGKSTLVELLLRLRLPAFGIYEVNGVSADRYSAEDWSRAFAYLPQDPQVVRGTVAENIRFFREHVTDEDIETAAALAHIDTVVQSWEDGYATVIGQREDAISGGQRQRVCLARALAGYPEVLILDEPTSALDLESEQLIQRSLAELKGAMTLIVVAHRVSTLQLCDRVMVLKDGSIEAFAEAPAVYGSNDFYRRAVDLAGLRSSG